MTTPPEFPPPMNHVFVDYENVHTFDPSVIGTKAVSFTLLLGAKQMKLDVELVEKLMKHAASVELIRLTSSGKNALDFTLSYYLGRKVQSDPTAYFHIVSKDKGYEPMMKHLRSRHIHVRRHDDCSTLTFSHKPEGQTRHRRGQRHSELPCRNLTTGSSPNGIGLGRCTRFIVCPAHRV